MRNRRAGNDSASRLLWVAGAMVSLLFVVAVSYAFYGERGAMNTAPQTISTDALTVTAERIALAETDTDGDGIPDWEEVLWGTDPTKIDSDGDGIPDARGTEAPEDWRTSTADILFNENASTTAVDTVTAVAARELFGTYMTEVVRNNTNLSPAEQARLVDQAIQSSAQLFVPPRMSMGDLIIVPSSNAAGQAYTRTMVALITELVGGAEYDFVLMRDLVGENRAVAVAGLERSVTHYNYIIERCKNVTVPEDAALLHADLVSGLMGYSFTIESIKDMERDPVRATAAVQLVLQYDQSLTATMNGLGRYFAAYTS